MCAAVEKTKTVKKCEGMETQGGGKKKKSGRISEEKCRSKQRNGS